MQGVVSLAPTFRVELDIPVTGDIITESLNFLTAGQVLNGTLAVDVKKTPVEGVDYQVVYMSGGYGEFDEITGGRGPACVFGPGNAPQGR